MTSTNLSTNDVSVHSFAAQLVSTLANDSTPSADDASDGHSYNAVPNVATIWQNTTAMANDTGIRDTRRWSNVDVLCISAFGRVKYPSTRTVAITSPNAKSTNVANSHADDDGHATHAPDESR